MTKTNYLVYGFEKLKEAERFNEKAEALLFDDSFEKSYADYLKDQPAWMILKEPLVWLGVLSAFAFVIRIFVFLFPWSQKEPIAPKDKIVVDTQYITGDTYNVSLNTKQLPAIGAMTYYFDGAMKVNNDAKLNQIRIESNGNIVYNLCRQADVSDCMEYSPKDDSVCLKFAEAKRDNCFDTSIIGSSEADLKGKLCNK